MMRSGMGKQMQGPRASMDRGYNREGFRGRGPMAVRPGIGRPDVITPVMPQNAAPPPNLSVMAGKLASQTPPMPANMPSSSGPSVPPVGMLSGGAPPPPMTQSGARSALGFKKGGMVSKSASKGSRSAVTPNSGKAGARSKPCKIY
jgi:hypothetical protein